MPVINALVELGQLRCNREGDGNGHSEPYIWPVLFQVDDDTLSNPPGSPVLVSMTSAPSAPFRVIVKGDMAAGEVAGIPARLSRMGARFRDGLQRANLILVVALLESDGTPAHAVDDGFVAYRSELRSALADHLAQLALATAEQREEIIEQIRKRVGDKVTSVIDDSLTAAEKAEIALGIVGIDDQIDSDFILFDQMTSRPFTLRFESDDGTSSYELDGQLAVTINLCQDELDKVNVANHKIMNIKGRIRQLLNAPENPDTEAEITRLQAELLVEGAKLRAAQEAHRQCLERFQVLDDTRPGSGGGVFVMDGGVQLHQLG